MEERIRHGVEGSEGGNVPAITVAANERIIKWHLAQQVSIQLGKEGGKGAVTADREDGREEVRAEEEKLKGCKQMQQLTGTTSGTG